MTSPSSYPFDAFEVPAAARGPIATWLDLLRQWNQRIDLTAARTDDELLDLMLADAAVLARRDALLPEGATVVDVGTGAGAPGLALALLRPDLKVTLVEPLAKRVSFLRTVLSTVGRADVGLLRERAEPLARTRASGWDIAVSRATLPPDEWIPVALRLAPSAWVLLARAEPPACEGARIDQDIAYTWPLTGASRRAVRYVRA